MKARRLSFAGSGIALFQVDGRAVLDAALGTRKDCQPVPGIEAIERVVTEAKPEGRSSDLAVAAGALKCVLIPPVGLLGGTVVFALDARLRRIPRLLERSPTALAWHIVPAKNVPVLFFVVGVSFRTGWLF